jgi:hypothetical protein
MAQDIARPSPLRPTRERGLGYALVGGIAITLIAALFGTMFLVWFYTVQRGAAAPELLPADVQFYVTLTPTIGDVIEAEPVIAALSEQLGVQDPRSLSEPVQGMLNVRFSDDVVTWMRSEAAIAVRGVDPAAERSAASLLRDGDVAFILASRNDPAAMRFLDKHLAARDVRGEQVEQIVVGDVTIYHTTNRPPSPITAVALIEHHVVFANRPEILVAMAEAINADQPGLNAVPAFAAFSANLNPRIPAAAYTDGTTGATAARDALRDLLEGLRDGS